MVKGLENTRLKAHHFALSGRLFRQHPFKLMLTYSANHGTYGRPYAGESAWNKEWGSVVETPLRQLSAGLSGAVLLRALGRGSHAASGSSASAGSALSALGSAASSPRAGRRPLDLSLLYGLYADRGSVLPDTFGLTLGARLSF
jgi:hypothetical protein